MTRGKNKTTAQALAEIENKLNRIKARDRAKTGAEKRRNEAEAERWIGRTLVSAGGADILAALGVSYVDAKVERADLGAEVAAAIEAKIADADQSLFGAAGIDLRHFDEPLTSNHLAEFYVAFVNYLIDVSGLIDATNALTTDDFRDSLEAAKSTMKDAMQQIDDLLHGIDERSD